MNEPQGPIAIISHNANEQFVHQVSDILCTKRKLRANDITNPHINTPGYSRSNYVLDSKLIRFQTGEGKFEIYETLRGHDVYIITDVLSRNIEFKLTEGAHIISPDDHYRDLLRIVQTAIGKARRVNIIMPYAYEGRTEIKSSSGESLDCAMMLKELYNLGVSHVIIFDPHDDRIANAVPLMSLDFPRCAYKIISTLLSKHSTIKADKDSTIVVSPDESGVNRGIFYSAKLNLPLGIFYRDRDYTRKVDGEHPIKDYRYLGDSVEGKDILIVDDMINSGSTMLRTSRKLKLAGARNIYCLSSFGLFTDGYELFDDAYEEGIIKSVICTNLIYRPQALLNRPWYIDVNMTPFVAKIIETINTDESLFDLINSDSKLSDFLGQIRMGELLTDFDDIDI